MPIDKPNGDLRICGDYSVTINKFSVMEQYPIPSLEELLSKLSGGTRFTKIDLSQAYHQRWPWSPLRRWPFDLVAQSVERRRSHPKVVGSIPTMVRVFLCPCVGPFPSVGLTLTWFTWFIWDRNIALHITLYSVNSV